jgi:magnesium transporter
VIRLLVRPPGGVLRSDAGLDSLPRLLRRRGSLIWLDFLAEPPEACEPILRRAFDFHPLAIDDALQETHVPKIDDWGDYLYVALHAVHLDPDGLELGSVELDAFLGRNYLVTHHDAPVAALDRIWDRCQRDPRPFHGRASRLFYVLTDELVSGTMGTVEDLDAALEAIEDEVLLRATPPTLERLFRLKRGLLRLRRVLGPQREVFNRLAREGYGVIEPDDRVYFRDVYDHLVRLHDIHEGMRDQASAALEIYLSVVNNRMTEVMKTLTIIATVFLPISFLTGFFGMNFFGGTFPIRADGWVTLFFAAASVMVVGPVGFLLWARRRGWF